VTFYKQELTGWSLGKMTKNELYKKAIEVFGRDRQLRQLQEELCELSLELIHFNHGKGILQNVWEEIVDVKIMCEQISIVLFDKNDILSRPVEKQTCFCKDEVYNLIMQLHYISIQIDDFLLSESKDDLTMIFFDIEYIIEQLDGFIQDKADDYDKKFMNGCRQDKLEKFERKLNEYENMLRGLKNENQ